MPWKDAVPGSAGRGSTLATVIETIDEVAPETKAELADHLGLSENYLSELFGELKRNGLIRKAYVVDRAAVLEAAPVVSEFSGLASDDAPVGNDLFVSLRKLDEVTTDQYAAARAAFDGTSPDPAADQLEPLANQRYLVVLRELKSLTITTDWPGNRIAADLAVLARNMEVVGDRACFIADTVRAAEDTPRGIVNDRVVEVFEGGATINDYLGDILFDAELTRLEALYREEKRVHRTLDELFELTTAYDPAVYGYLVAVTRALERAIHYWVSAAEIAVRLHTGLGSKYPVNVG